ADPRAPPEVALELAHQGDVTDDADDAQILALAALERRRAELGREGGAVAAPERERHARDRRVASQSLGQQIADLGSVGEELRAVPAHGLAAEYSLGELGRRVERDHATVEIDRDVTAGERPEDVVGVTLEVGDLLELPPQAGVRLLQRGPLLEELRGHVIERRREPPDLVLG